MTAELRQDLNVYVVQMEEINMGEMNEIDVRFKELEERVKAISILLDALALSFKLHAETHPGRLV